MDAAALRKIFCAWKRRALASMITLGSEGGLVSHGGESKLESEGGGRG